MAIVFSVLLAGMGAFVLAYFPSREARANVEDFNERAAAVTNVMATALGPAVEFDDPDNAASILKWLSTTSDARFGLARRADGALLAVWKPDAVPSGQAWGRVLAFEVSHDLLVVTIPIAATGGTLHVGFSRVKLVAENTATRHTVMLVVAIVLAIGVLATMVLARFLVRPIRSITRTAERIARGEITELPDVSSTIEIEEMARSLRAMIERIHEASQTELVRASRQAGMAEVATGVLHNVGNVLTSVNVTVELLRERVEELPVAKIGRLHELLSAQTTGTFDAKRLDAAVKFVAIVGDAFAKSQRQVQDDLVTLRGHIDHIKRVVAMQNAYARLRSAAEPTRVADVLAEAVEMGCPPQRRGDIAIDIDVAADLDAPVNLDRHRLLQIVVNLVSNARDAVLEGTSTHRIALLAARADNRLRIRVVDSGVGIAPALAARIFSAGVTSKPHGHGYGLHSSALAAREIGGSLSCSSEGEGRGATFVLELPIEEVHA
jgi:signal transduction histidine kinase